MAQPQQGKPSGISKFLSSTATKIASRLPSELDQIPHQLRHSAAQFNPANPADTLALHLTIKSASGVVSDVAALGREQQSYSKQLYLFTKDAQSADIKDVGDRLAFLEFKKGELYKAHAAKLELARVALKEVRNFENTLVPKRKRQAELRAKLEHNAETTKQAEYAKLKAELDQLVVEERANEDKLRLLRRQKMHEAFSIEFDAQRELGEKLAILGTYGTLLVRGMDMHGIDADYEGHNYTARIRAEIDNALSSWSLANAKIPVPWLDNSSNTSFLGRADTLSFGSTHTSELSEIPDSSSLHAVAHATPGPAAPPLPLRSQGTSSQSQPTTMPAAIPLNLATTSPPTRAGLSATAASSSTSPPLRDPFAEDGHTMGASSSLEAAPNAVPGPTVSETGNVRSGTGGPSTGVLSTSPGKPVPHPVRLADFAGSPSSAHAAVASGTGTMTAGAAGEAAAPPPSYDEAEERRAEQQADLILAREREAKRAPLP